MNRRTWVVWIAGVFAYLIAVMQRSTFGVAGLEASAHFGASASIVSMFVVLQLGVYAAAQVPVGLLLDRFGTRRLVTTGALLMGVGQVVVGAADLVGVAILGRVLLGLGDAMTFNSVLRLIPYWFSAPRIPLATQMTSLIGQLGQVLSAIPFLALLTGQGWRTAFFAAAAASLVVAVTSALFLRNAPEGKWEPDRSASLAEVTHSLGQILRQPGNQLAFCIHFTICFSTMVFAFMWGYPFMTAGLGLSDQLAGLLLSLFAVIAVPMGPVLGHLTARFPARRTLVALVIIWAQLLGWVTVLLWPGNVPLAILVLLLLVLASGGPGSNIAFDYARSTNPAPRVGTATGIVIVAGFTACLVSIWVVGLVLDWSSGGGAYDLGDFRVALATQLPLYALGLVGVHVAAARYRRAMAAAGMRIPSVRESWLRLRHNR